MTKTIEIYAFLHSIANGVVTVTKGNSDIGKVYLPANEIELTMTQDPRRALIRLPEYLALGKELMAKKPESDPHPQISAIDERKTQSILERSAGPVNGGGRLGQAQAAVALTKGIAEAVDRELKTRREPTPSQLKGIVARAAEQFE